MAVPTEYGYRYRALSAADSVRLLTISRADDQPHGMLLSLKEAQLDDQPDFVALSYTWKLPEYVNRGNLEDQESGATIEVICDGKVMAISENLFNFLCAALHASEPNDGASDTKTKLVSKVNGILKDLPLWIDAFCINQSCHGLENDLHGDTPSCRPGYLTTLLRRFPAWWQTGTSPSTDTWT
ncbi:hypothetical protein CGMCC3_g2025 [Colletotrichum fructicola]|uniref:Het domain protein n=1 Tax=Colletotrichum fructicola (strain Nara gc5) TaxID=1213859 RepID=L2G4I4_COLFN|nr:uncharacterized protein CGMCC3_g2025 [Colletotrichum fructicola]KAE9581788.1 hypothetical protein CGMCC3_g2025 [Colletotrichum fructicola]